MITTKIESNGFFEGKPDEELITIYKELCGEGALPCPREQMVERILTVLSTRRPRLRGNAPRRTRGPQTENLNEKRGRPHKPFNFPPKPGNKIARPRSMRATALNILKRGGTVEEVMAATGLITKHAYNLIRQLHDDMGYGIREDEEGRISVYQ